MARLLREAAAAGLHREYCLRLLDVFFTDATGAALGATGFASRSAGWGFRPRRTVEQAGARAARAHRRGAVQSRHRRAAVPLAADREGPRPQHLLEAGREQPHPGGRSGENARHPVDRVGDRLLDARRATVSVLPAPGLSDTEAIAERLSPAFTVTVRIAGRRIAFARVMTRLTRPRGGWRPRVAAARHAFDVGVHDDRAAVDRQPQCPRGRGDEVGDALELGVRLGLGPCARAPPMPAQSVDPRIDEEREQPGAECAAHDHAGEEGQGQPPPRSSGHQGVDGAHTRPAGPGSRCGSDQRTVMPQAWGGAPRFLFGRLGHGFRPSCGRAQIGDSPLASVST